MKKAYLIFSGFTIMLFAAACNSGDKAAKPEEEAGTEQTAQQPGEQETAPAIVAGPKVVDKSTISTKDIDPKDTSFTSRIKAVYRSEETGKLMAVVLGLKNDDHGIAIIEKEGEKPVTLKQSTPLSNSVAEYTNGSVTLTTGKEGVKLTDNGEVVQYTAVQY